MNLLSYASTVNVPRRLGSVEFMLVWSHAVRKRVAEIFCAIIIQWCCIQLLLAGSVASGSSCSFTDRHDAEAEF